jgi:hypothetical protein
VLLPSRWWWLSCWALFALFIFLLFFVSALFLEAKVLIILVATPYISDWAKKTLTYQGSFLVRSDSFCVWQKKDYQIQRILLHTPFVILLELKNQEGVIRLPVFADALKEDDFRSLSRICLNLSFTEPEY